MSISAMTKSVWLFTIASFIVLATCVSGCTVEPPILEPVLDAVVPRVLDVPVAGMLSRLP